MNFILACKYISIKYFMKFLFWNCRGAGSEEFCAVMHDLRKNHKFQIGAVAEPRVSGFRADKIIEKLKFESSFRVEAQGMSGGLWLMWNNSNVNVKILNSSRHFIHGSVDEGSSEAWLFTVVYANSNAILKK
jgi:hypothetical protein